jgi:hypothetical protein
VQYVGYPFIGGDAAARAEYQHRNEKVPEIQFLAMSEWVFHICWPVSGLDYWIATPLATWNHGTARFGAFFPIIATV